MNKRYCSVNNWLIDISSGSIIHLTTGERKRLGEYQLKLLDVLTQNAGKILTREELTTLVWEHRVIGNNSLPNAIHALRTALEDDGKQQKIIKTTPRKGYFLEQEYCCLIEKEEEDVRDNSADVMLSETVQHDNSVVESVADSSALLVVGASPVQTEIPSPVQLRPTHLWWQSWHAITMLVVAAMLITAASLWGYFEFRPYRLVYEQHEANVYNNIQLYEIYPANDANDNKLQLNDKLKASLYSINQLLKSKSITMNIYYQSIDQTLNYTFSLKNACTEKQLAMAIYHWRVDVNQLNNLILRETRRKIAEMGNCTGG